MRLTSRKSEPNLTMAGLRVISTQLYIACVREWCQWGVEWGAGDPLSASHLLFLYLVLFLFLFKEFVRFSFGFERESVVVRVLCVCVCA